MKIVEFYIDAMPLSLNKYLRMHWRTRAEHQKTWDMLVFCAWNKHDRLMILDPVTIHYCLYFESNRQRDYDNYIAATKFLTDALKRTFLVRDDSAYVRGINVSFERGEGNTLVIINKIGG